MHSIYNLNERVRKCSTRVGSGGGRASTRIAAAIGLVSLVIGGIAANASTAGAAETCTQDGTGVTISDMTQFDLLAANRSIESGSLNGEGTVYRYAQADPDGRYDVLVTAVDVNNDSAPTDMIDPVQDTETAGVERWMTPAWQLDDGTRTGAPFDVWQTFRLEFVVAGTNTPAAVTVFATSADNDGALNGTVDDPGATVQEWVRYDTLPNSWIQSTASILHPEPNGFILGGVDTLPSITVEETMSITGVYRNITGFTWTSGHRITPYATDYDGLTARLAALSLNCEPAVQGVANPDLVLEKQLVSSGVFYPGNTVQYELTPRNIGYADAIAGWTVNEVAPPGMTITAMAGNGYRCDVAASTCTAEALLAADTVGSPVTVTAQIDSDASGLQHNVAYVEVPADQPTAETVPLGTPPDNATDTAASVTNNDAQADLTVTVPDASIELLKSVSNANDTDADGFVGEGDVIDYKMKVTNTGNVDLAPVTISDTKLSLLNEPCVAVLAVGQTLDCGTPFHYTITAADVSAGGVVNTAVATGVPPTATGLGPVTDTSDTGTPPTGEPGTPTPITDPSGENTPIPDTVTTDVDNTPDPTDDPTVVVVKPRPSVVLVKSVLDVVDANEDGLNDAGDVVTFGFTVTNTGNVVLAPVVISDPKLGIVDAPCVDSLAVGATSACSTTGTYVLTADDVAVGGTENTATATATPPTSTHLGPVTDVSDTGTPAADTSGPPTPITNPGGEETDNPLGLIDNDEADPGEDPTSVLTQTPAPAIDLIKTFVAHGHTVGSKIDYTLVSTNVGNTPLTNVTISDPMLGLDHEPCADRLEVGESCQVTASYTITQADVDRGRIDNTATTEGTDPSGGTVTDTSDTGTDTEEKPVVDPPTTDSNGDGDPQDDPTTVLIPAVPPMLPAAATPTAVVPVVRTGTNTAMSFGVIGLSVLIAGMASSLLGRRRRANVGGSGE